jgi:peptide/nickel transport system permease protein
MTRYLTKRLLAGAVVLLLIAAITFVAFFVLPADPAVQACGKACTPERIQLLHHQMGLDKPVLRQFVDYLGGIFTGRTYGTGPKAAHCPVPCLGFSYRNNLPVWKLLVNRFPVTFSIAIGAAVLWLLMGVSVGVFSALRRGSGWDRGAMMVALAGVSLPMYVAALAVLYVLVVKLGVLPRPEYVPFASSPLRWGENLLLPWFTLAFLNAAVYARLTRAGMVDTMGENFIRTARAKGLPERTVVVKHGLRAGLTPIVTIFGLDLGGLLGGAVLTERVFGMPGLGQLTIDAIGTADQPVVLGVVLLSAALIVVANIVVDILYAVLDPRVRYA